jgi:hypothetical protein
MDLRKEQDDEFLQSLENDAKKKQEQEQKNIEDEILKLIYTESKNEFMREQEKREEEDKNPTIDELRKRRIQALSK